ncbi:PREDICTED: hippocalcin-like protein 4 [Vollenhovia emeryi]|uniref:hippocalcin-like protein 4 n=1 Tax=Vollenhovia emeryi TaxID=411798 RepID=UPI0005F57897|nr:PREDICTED: hippocalcin-like protein 4 [Vollenhovia emeryi]XP_011877944.1 PREDICTED: hippocalcin-like protein 4 [Vollenhovia emeryi]
MSNHGSADGKGNCESLRRPSLSVKMQRSLKKMRKSFKRITESIQEDDKHSLYIFPEQLSTLTCRTGFSKDEIRKLYRAFKQLCPRGCATSGDLKPAYSKLFPLGDPARYAQIVFNSFDRDGDGVISFSDLLGAMTLIVNGNVDQKLSWIFGFYDLNGDGCITRQEMLVIISAIYEMVQNTQTIQSVVDKQVDRFFEKMDTDRDGLISMEEFVSSCKNDAIIYNQLFLFNNIW